MNELAISLLCLVLVIVAANLVVVVVLWWRHAGLADRVTKLEIHQEHSLTRTEMRQLFDRMASMEGQLQTTNRLLQTVQEHLLEND